MATQAKSKLPYKVGDEVQVKAKVTRIAQHERLPEVTLVSVQMPNGNHETFWITGDDASTISRK